MDRTGRDEMAGQLRLLAEKMNSRERLRDSHLETTGWITRQALSNERTKHDGNLSFTHPGGALALIQMACERGYAADVLAILNGQEFSSEKVGTLARATHMYPDLSFEEAEMLGSHEDAFTKAGRNTLQPELIRALVIAFRAPSD